MDKQTLTLIKRDISQDAAIEIATYQNFGEGMKYITYKNEKPIAWSCSLAGAMEFHNMYVKIQILKEEEEIIDIPKYYSGVKSEKKNNSFLHDFI